MGLLRTLAKHVAKDAGREGVEALEREAQRRRDEACSEVVRLAAKVARLERIERTRKVKPLIGWRIRVAKEQLGRAQDRCAALRAMEGDGW